MKDAFDDLQNGTVYRSDLLQCRKLNISSLRIDLRFRHQAVWREAHGQDPYSYKKKSVAYHNCPLSPLLFSLYINDMGREISEGIEGAVTGDRVNCVSHMLYADDLGLTTNDPGEMQTMLNKLHTYAEKKGLTVNTAKSEVVHFNSNYL